MFSRSRRYPRKAVAWVTVWVDKAGGCGCVKPIRQRFGVTIPVQPLVASSVVVYDSPT
jgi:hypothetical protein